MAWIKKGQLFELVDVKHIALNDSYIKIVRDANDWECAKYGIDSAVVNEFVYAQPLGEKPGHAVYVNLHDAANNNKLKIYSA